MIALVPELAHGALPELRAKRMPVIIKGEYRGLSRRYERSSEIPLIHISAPDVIRALNWCQNNLYLSVLVMPPLKACTL